MSYICDETWLIGLKACLCLKLNKTDEIGKKFLDGLVQRVDSSIRCCGGAHWKKEYCEKGSGIIGNDYGTCRPKKFIRVKPDNMSFSKSNVTIDSNNLDKITNVKSEDLEGSICMGPAWVDTLTVINDEENTFKQEPIQMRLFDCAFPCNNAHPCVR